MKKVRFNNEVEIKYYSKTDKEQNNLETLSTIHRLNPDSNYKYIIGLLLICLLVFFIIFLTI